MEFKMKATILFALLFISFDIFAITGKDDWKTIRKSREVLIQHPSFTERFGPKKIFNICVSGDEFKSIGPVKNCVAYNEVESDDQNRSLSGYKEYNCTKFITENIVMNRVHTNERCVRFAPINEYTSGECLEYSPVTSFYPTSYSLPIIEADGDQYGTHLFSKTYAIPECQ